MITFKHSSLGYLSGLFVLGAASALMGCGGDGSTDPAQGASKNANAPSAVADPHAGAGPATQAGSASDATGGTSGSSATSGTPKGTAGAVSNTGARNGDASGASAGETSTGGSGGSAQGSGGAAGSDHGPTLMSADYSIDAFHVDDPAHPQPLLSAELTLAPRDEVSLLVASSHDSFGKTLDDAQNGYAPLSATATALLTGATLVDTASGNLDDDGNAELVAAAFVGSELQIRVADSRTAPGPQAAREDTLFSNIEEFTVTNQAGNSASPFTHANVSVGDADQDGRDEILVTAVTTDGQVVARVYDDSIGSYAFLAEPFRAKGKHVAAIFGNFDDDAAPELAVLVDTGAGVDQGKNLELHMFDDASSGYAPLTTLIGKDTGLLASDTFATNNVKLLVGNFDLDAREELVAIADGTDSGENGTGPQLNVAVFDDACGSVACSRKQPGFQPFPGGKLTLAAPDAWQAVVADTRVQIPNANPDVKPGERLTPKLDEVFIVESVEAENTNGKDIVLLHLPFGSSAWTGGNTLRIAKSVSSPTFAVAAAAGRLDNLASDVIVAVKTDTTLTPTRVWSDGVTGTSPTQYGLESTALAAYTVPSESAPVFVTAGDFDADSMRVRYTGNRHQELMNPKPIAVVSTPPVKAGIAQNYADSWTSYGATQSQKQDETTEYVVTDAVTFSTDISPPVIGDFFGLTAEYSLSQQFGTTSTQTSMKSFTSTSTVGYPDDMVVFHGTLCEVYEYEIVSAGNSGALSGKITINEPIATDTYAWRVSDYNAELTGVASPLDASVITHTPGDPASYPHKPDQDTNGLPWMTDPATVPSGTNLYQTVGIDVSTETAKGMSTTSSSSAGGGSTGLVGIKYTESWDQTGSYTFTVGNAFHYYGQVGGIDRADYDYAYKFGLWVHEATLADQTVIQVVDYYTDAADRSAYKRAAP
jgi:hypothetical protein